MARVGDKQNPVHFDRHSPDYIHRFTEITHQLHGACPVAWTETYGRALGGERLQQVFELARNAALLSNDRDPKGERSGYVGIAIPNQPDGPVAGFLEMDPPAQRDYRRALDPYLSPAAVARWKPMTEDLTPRLPGREDRVRPDRFRRRPGQRGPRCDDPGAHGPASLGLGRLLRADSCFLVHAAGFAGYAAGHRSGLGSR